MRMWKTRLLLTLVFVMLVIAPFAHASCHDTGDGFIPNPLKVCSFADLLKAIADAVVAIGSILAALALIFVGFKLVLAAVAGNPAGITAAKKMFWWVLIGAAVVVGSAAIAGAVVNFVKNL